MTILNWVSTMIGVDLLLYPEYEYLFIACSVAILIIFVSTVYTMLMTLGGIFSPRRG